MGLFFFKHSNASVIQTYFTLFDTVHFQSNAAKSRLSAFVSVILEIPLTAHSDNNLTETQVWNDEGGNSPFPSAIKYHWLQFNNYALIKFKSRISWKSMKTFQWICEILDKVVLAHKVNPIKPKAWIASEKQKEVNDFFPRFPRPAILPKSWSQNTAISGTDKYTSTISCCCFLLSFNFKAVCYWHLSWFNVTVVCLTYFVTWK